MIADSSALISMLFKEPGYELLLAKIQGAASLFVGAPTAVETAIVVSHRLRQDARSMLASFLYQLNAEIVEFNQQHYEAAVTAFLRFGKGRHPAALNFGDCMTYALASVSGLPLLCVGEEFARTGVQCA